MTFGAAKLSMIGLGNKQFMNQNFAYSSLSTSGVNKSFDQLKQIEAGVLDVGYAEAGPAEGAVVILLHGWPYDIHSFTDVAPACCSRLQGTYSIPAWLWYYKISFG